MPIGGVVITGRPEKTALVLQSLQQITGVEVHGHDAAGNIVAVLDAATSGEMETMVDRINRDEHVLGVGMTYLNTEDEAELLAQGERLEKPFGFRKGLAKES